MNKKNIIKKVANHVERKFTGEGTGHDWWHIYRVWQMARYIGRQEKVDLFIVDLGALLHDIADFKFHNGDETIGGKQTTALLRQFKVDDATIKQVIHIVDNVSFKGANVKSKMRSLEGKIVQDADRLEALGAIGIARAFAYGGSKRRPLYEPEAKPKIHRTFKAYKKGSASTINHFYEKLLYIKNTMNTKTGKKIAAERHKFIEAYLERFFQEWEGKK